MNMISEGKSAASGPILCLSFEAFCFWLLIFLQARWFLEQQISGTSQSMQIANLWNMDINSEHIYEALQ